MSDQINRAAQIISGAMFGLTTESMVLAIARDLDAAGLLTSPEHDAAVAAKAWDEGYAVGEDNFIHSDYCGRACQCQGLHGTTNPYLTKGGAS